MTDLVRVQARSGETSHGIVLSLPVPTPKRAAETRIEFVSRDAPDDLHTLRPALLIVGAE